MAGSVQVSHIGHCDLDTLTYGTEHYLSFVDFVTLGYVPGHACEPRLEFFKQTFTV